MSPPAALVRPGLAAPSGDDTGLQLGRASPLWDKGEGPAGRDSVSRLSLGAVSPAAWGWEGSPP